MLDHLIHENDLKKHKDYKKADLKEEDINFVKALIHRKGNQVSFLLIFLKRKGQQSIGKQKNVALGNPSKPSGVQ